MGIEIDLTGKTALVTGATTGIGRAAAQLLHRAGARVVVHGSTQENAEAALPTIGSGERLVAIGGRLDTAESCAALCAAIDERVPQVEILVNNAGIYPRKPAPELGWEDYERVLRVNTLSGAELIRHFTPKMRQAKYGRVISVSSEHAVSPAPDMIPYGLSKMGQLVISRAWAVELAASGVTVNCIMPGPTYAAANAANLAELVESGRAADERAAGQIISASRPPSLLGRWTWPEEVAQVIVWLASPLSGTITGSTIDASGGMGGLR